MKQHKEQYAIAKMVKVLGVSRSGYYAWEERKPSLHEIEDLFYAKLIEKIFNKHFKRYGSPRVWVELKAQGYKVMDFPRFFGHGLSRDVSC